MKTYRWTTNKGANVEITVSQEHTEIINADGDKIETTKREMRLENLKINGTEYEGILTGKMVEFKMGNRNAGAYIPEDIYQKIMQPTLERWEAESKADAEYQKHHAAVEKMMSY